jgi:hypothetical protein
MLSFMGNYLLNDVHNLVIHSIVCIANSRVGTRIRARTPSLRVTSGRSSFKNQKGSSKFHFGR